MSLIGSLVAFVVSLLVGGLAIFIAASVVSGTQNYEYAVFTALIGAIVWGIVELLLSSVPLIGEFLPLIAWVAVIKWRYGESWVNAGIIGYIAWGAAILVLTVLPMAGIDAVGIPFT